MRNAGRVGAVGLEFGMYVVICLVGGWWADEKLGTSPWLALLGVIIGSTAGFMALVRAAKLSSKDDDSEKKPGADDPEV